MLLKPSLVKIFLIPPLEIKDVGLKKLAPKDFPAAKLLKPPVKPYAIATLPIGDLAIF